MENCDYEFIDWAGAGNLPTVKAFLDAGINPDISGYYTALNRSAANGHLEVVNVLIEAEANVNNGIRYIFANRNSLRSDLSYLVTLSFISTNYLWTLERELLCSRTFLWLPYSSVRSY